MPLWVGSLEDNIFTDSKPVVDIGSLYKLWSHIRILLASKIS